MRFLSMTLLTVAISCASQQIAVAQRSLLNTENNVTGATNTGSVSGQTGQSENFNIQRDPTSFIGGAASNIIGAQTGTAGLNRLGAGGMLGGLGGLGGGLGGFGRGNMGFGNQANTQTSTEPQIRFRMTLGFSHPRPTETAISARFTQRLSRLPQLPSAPSVAVTMEDRTAILAGEVESEREKRLIEKLAMMEPGVSAVRNELTVKATPELLAPSGATN